VSSPNVSEEVLICQEHIVVHTWKPEECSLCKARREGAAEGLRMANGLMFMVKNEIYDGECDMTKRFTVRLEKELMKHREGVLAGRWT